MLESNTDNNNNNKNNQNTDDFKVIIKFTPKNRSYSFKVPYKWNIRQFQSFIIDTFEDDINNLKPIFIIKGKSIKNDSINLPLSSIFSYDYNMVIISLSEDNDNNDRLNQTKTEILSSDEFLEAENDILEYYKNTVNHITNKNNEGISFLSFPLMHHSISQRIEVLYSKEDISKLSYDPGKMERYPLLGYIKFRLLFNLILFYFLGGIYVKGWNHALFVSFLVGYYWKSLRGYIEEFYNKKRDEIKLTEEEVKEIKMFPNDVLFKNFHDDKNENKENININQQGELKDKDKDKDNRAIEDEEKNKNIRDDDNIINKDKTNEQIDFGANPNFILSAQKKIIFPNPNNTKGEKNIEMKEMKGISNILLKLNSEKKKEKKEQNHPKNPFSIIITILYTFIISFIPTWCEEFEQQNPFPSEETTNHNEQQQRQDGAINQNEEEKEKENEQISNENEQNSDSRHVNISEDLNLQYKLIKPSEKDPDNKAENEYIFSENFNIDNLSQNELYSEQYKQRMEREKEKEYELKNDNEKDIDDIQIEDNKKDK